MTSCAAAHGVCAGDAQHDTDVAKTSTPVAAKGGTFSNPGGSRLHQHARAPARRGELTLAPTASAGLTWRQPTGAPPSPADRYGGPGGMTAGRARRITST